MNINFSPTKNFIRNNLNFILIGLLAVTGATNIIFYNKLSNYKKNPEKIIQEQTASLIEKVGKLVVLPTDEKPTIATVSDPELLKDQPFFAKAQKGFKVLVYSSSGKSILYDPFEDRVVEVASINTNSQSQVSPTPVSSLSPTPKKK